MPILFDGADDSVNAGTGFANFLKTDPFSVSALVNSNSNQIQHIIGNWNPGTTAGWLLAFDPNGRFRFLLSNVTGGARVDLQTIGADFSDGAWHHVMATYDGSVDVSGMNIYVDGTTPTPNDVENSDPGVLGDDNMLIGLRNDGNIPMDGEISDLVIWNAELTLQDAQQIYNSKMVLMPYQIAAANRVEIWHMDDGPDGTSADGDTVKGAWNGNDGTGDNGGNNTGLTWKANPVLTYSANIIRTESVPFVSAGQPMSLRQGITVPYAGTPWHPKRINL